ncbi:MAG: glycosyltransferase family 4 protein [Hyphomicrobiales bacterium]
MPQALRVFLNGSAVPRRPAGAGVYTLELARALAAREDIDLVVALPGMTLREARTVTSPKRGPLFRSLWEQVRMPRLLAESELDLYHGAHFSVPLRTRLPRVTTVHDLTFYRLPHRYRTHRRWYYRSLAQLARRADRVIVPSRAVAGDVVRHLGYPPERIRVVPEAPRSGFERAAPPEVATLCKGLGVEPGYLLCVGTAEPGKRAVDAIRALQVLREKGERFQLVIAGNDGPLSEPLEREARRLGVGDDVRFAGYIADEELSALYSGALALVFPSLYEGFGLPPLEAMACGTPVISARAPAMDDVLRDAALFVPLRDPAAIACAVLALRDDAASAAEYRERGYELVRELTWEHAAELTAEVYREVAG